VAYAARAAAELGVDIVKTYYTGDPNSYRMVIEACPAYVVVSSLSKLDDLTDVFRMTREAMDSGAAGRRRCCDQGPQSDHS
jgi:class I fructose-bisphosphate aldolase